MSRETKSMQMPSDGVTRWLDDYLSICLSQYLRMQPHDDAKHLPDCFWKTTNCPREGTDFNKNMNTTVFHIMHLTTHNSMHTHAQ